MATGQSARGGAASNDIESWMERRRAQVRQLGREAEVAGRRTWTEATQTGQNVLARTQSELAAVGAQRLLSGSGGLPSTQAESEPSASSWLDQNTLAKAAGGTVARLGGTVVGLGQGVVHSAEGLGQGLLFISRLVDPADVEENGPDKAAWGQVFSAAKAAVDYAHKGFHDPGGVADDVRRVGQKIYSDTMPSATPVADTFGGEMRRNFELGTNQGELSFELGSLVFGGAASKALRGLGDLGEASGAAKFVAQGFTPAQAEYLAAPYEGMGSHFVGRALARKIGLPGPVTNGPLNVLKPKISRGDFYELHFKVDPYFYGAKLAADGGGGSWSGKRLGLKKHGLLGRIWQGSPAPLNGVAGLSGAAGLANDDAASGGAP